MPFPFNKALWEYGQKIEDIAMPICNELFDCDFKKNDKDIFDIIDFKDHDKKIVCEIKGRKIKHDTWADTIIPASKVMSGYQHIDDGYEVFFIFVFTDKMFKYQLHEENGLKCKFTGTNCIKHYLIPLVECKEIEGVDEEMLEVN